MFTFSQRGVLRKDAAILPLPLAESYRLNMRVALALLNWYFSGEENEARKAWSIHYALGRRITVSPGWQMSEADLSEAVLSILLGGRTAEPFVIMSAERRDQLRKLALSESTYGGRRT